MSTIPTRRRPLGSGAPASISMIHDVNTRPAGTQRPPCAAMPDDWDLDVGNPDSWRAAVAVCHGCPMFVACGELAETLTARGDGPRAMIWAGVAYDSAGRVVENLDRHRVAPTEHKRPLRIIRNGDRQLCAEPPLPTPHRRILLGHRLRPVVSGGH